MYSTSMRARGVADIEWCDLNLLAKLGEYIKEHLGNGVATSSLS
jgi:hypothetical protein